MLWLCWWVGAAYLHQGRSHFVGVPVLVEAILSMWWGESLFKGLSKSTSLDKPFGHVKSTGGNQGRMTIGSRVDRECQTPASIIAARQKESKKNFPHQALFSLEKVSTDSAPQAPSIKLVNTSPSGMTQMLFFCFIFLIIVKCMQHKV